MKLAEALSIVQKAPAGAAEYPVLLACGFTPLHLQNFFAAYLQKSVPARKVRVSVGLYGDVAGTLEQWAAKGAQTGALVLEWADLDPRLGYRQLGGWGQRVSASVVSSVTAMLARLEKAIYELPSSARLALAMPTLPLPPGFHTTGAQASETELALDEAAAAFARRVSAHPAVRVVHAHRLDTLSTPGSRYDFRSDVNTGFPYTNVHAEALGSALAAVLEAQPPIKGLITDLDDTLWLGIVGEVGHENVSWDLSNHSQLHGLYQQMLRSLAEHGVLIAIASKNSPEVVNRALGRSDLAITRDQIFPLEVHWEAKSGSVARILKTWNIGADSVVFVDDSPMEIEEVRAAHPEVECILFPKNDYAAGLQVLRRLRDLFGKPRLSEEDSFRLQSIRDSQAFVAGDGAGGASAEDFLSGAEATVTLEYNPPASDTRVVELVNKTNQFNINGIRFSDAEWHASLKDPARFALAISYADKFGPLGKIAVLRGRVEGAVLHVETWVMSCRAFSRRIEHQTLTQLFDKFGVDEMVFQFQPTPKNGPAAETLTALLGEAPTAEARLTRTAFEAARPKLYHTVINKNG